MKCSTFTGFSKHREDLDILVILEQIKQGMCLKVIDKLRLALRQGRVEEAGRIKKQLKAATLSALYRERRVPEMISGYNDVIMLDFDKLDTETLKHCREVIETATDTLFCFLSPSGNGLKVGVYLRTSEAEELRQSVFRIPESDSIDFYKLEAYHKKQFELAAKHYEHLCGVPVDSSGSDIGRLFFYSYDPNVYVNTEALKAVQIPQIAITTPEKKKKPYEYLRMELPGNPDADCTNITPQVKMEFEKCAANLQRTTTYEPGGRDNFLFALGNKCYRKGLPLRAVEQLAERYFGTPDMDVRMPIRNAYRYTSKSDRLKEEEKKPVGQRIVEFADRHYDVRRNTIMKRLEFRNKKTEDEFVPMKAMHYNTIFLDLNLAGINCGPTTVKAIINSRYARDYNPFEDYFYNLPPWDGRTDYIAELANTVRTTNPVFWKDCFRRWLTGLVACALDERTVNQLALVIRGDQGKGKSTWIRQLLPPELRLHYRNGMLHPDNKDHALALTTCLIINLEEFEGMKNGEISDLKRLITQESVMERKAFDTDADLYIRCASIIASTNEPRFLQDISGTRRFPTVTALEIDYQSPVNHRGIYAQALHLWKSGFRFWYEKEEIDMLNKVNREYSLAAPEVELFYVYFDRPAPTDYEGVKWVPVAAVMSHLSIYGKISMSSRTMKLLASVLENNGFEKRVNGNGIYEYKVRVKNG